MKCALPAHSKSRHGQNDLDDQAAVVGIQCANAAGVHLHNAIGNCEPKPGTIGIIAGARHPLAGGKKTTAQTDGNGAYRFESLTPGSYDVSVQQRGFAPQTLNGLRLSPGANTHDFQLSVTIEEQRVTVDDIRGVSTDPNRNKTARVISGKDLNSLSDDPNELAAQLDALAGPAAGPNGTQVFVDGACATT